MSAVAVQWDYLDLNLKIDPWDGADGPGVAGYRVNVVGSPAGVATGTFIFPLSPADLDVFRLTVGPPRVSSRRILPRATGAHTATEYGRRLYDAVFSGDVASCFRASLSHAEAHGKGLRIRLDLTDAPALDNVPWEYLYATALGRFLAMSAQTPVVRYFHTPYPARTLRVEPPLRVLVMISSPTDVSTLEVDKEEALLRANTADMVQAGLLDVVVEREATVASLQRQLSYERFHVFHFIGHGAFDDDAGEGVLCFEHSDGRAHLVRGSYVGTLLHDARSMQLAVLNACEGARTSGQDMWSGVGQSLVRQGLPAVVAMQTEISDRAALAFSHEFYYAMSRGFPVDAAVAEARKAIGGADDDAEWGTPVLLQSAIEEPFELVTTLRPELAPDLRHQQLFQAAEAAVTAGSPTVAGALLDQLRRLAPDDRRVADLSARVVSLTRPVPPQSQSTTAAADPADPAAGASDIAPDRGSPPGSAPRRPRRPVGTRLAVAAMGALAVALVVGLWLRQGAQGPPDASAGAPTGAPTVTAVRSAASTATAPSTSGRPASKPTSHVLYQGRLRLQDPTMNLDLVTGGLKFVLTLEGHIGWTGAELLIYDETTLGAAVLSGLPFEETGPAQLMSASYRRGAENPSRSPADLPVGAVLAVRVNPEDFAKIAVTAYGTDGDVELRWVTYRIS